MCVAVSTDFMKWLRLVRGEDDWMGLIFASKYNREFYFWESS